MLNKIRRLSEKLATDGWTPAEVDRLIASVEADGVASEGERSSIRELLDQDGFVGPRPAGSRGDNFLGHSRRRLESYVAFAGRVAQGSPGAPKLLGKGDADVDQARYRTHVEILAGERAAVVRDGDGAPREVEFKDRFVPSPTNQLKEVLDWLGAYYTSLELPWELQPVTFRGKTYYNMVVTIPGESDEAVILCDHYDVADKEHIRGRNLGQLEKDHGLTKEQIAARAGSLPVGAPVPGADDNASASAALMEMGTLMRKRLDAGVSLGKTVKLVHLVGEELPANCLGARQFVKKAKENGEKIAAVVVLDMIGVDRTGARKVQVSVGRHPGSLELAACVKDAIRDHGLDLKPVLRPYGSRRSFLHQTDAIHFSKAGVPTILLNEHLNDHHDLYRVGYHDEFDTTALISFGFATDVTRAALETVYRMAAPKEPVVPAA